MAKCAWCGSGLNIVEEVSFRAGLATKLHFSCENVNCTYVSPGFFTTRKTGKIHDVNTQLVVGGRMAGKGRSGLAKITSVLGLHAPVANSAFAVKTKDLEEKASVLLQQNLSDAAKRARRAVGGCEDQTVDVPCSHDGAWATRGWKSRKGVVTTIAESTSQVLDIIFKNTECRSCALWNDKKTKKEISMLEYLEWFSKHEIDCMLNHDGSAQSMEASGVMQIYQRSMEKHNIRYRPFIGDGDSSSYTSIEKESPHGVMYPVEKEECVSHITKRMGSNLRELLKEYKGKKLTDGKALGGKGGGLTLNRVDTIQNFYGKCIRDNKGDADAMSKGFWAILDHYSSTLSNWKTILVLVPTRLGTWDTPSSPSQAPASTSCARSNDSHLQPSGVEIISRRMRSMLHAKSERIPSSCYLGYGSQKRVFITARDIISSISGNVSVQQRI